MADSLNLGHNGVTHANGRDETNTFRIAQKQLDLVAEMIHLDPCVHAVLREPKRELTVNFPVTLFACGSVYTRSPPAAVNEPLSFTTFTEIVCGRPSSNNPANGVRFTRYGARFSVWIPGIGRHHKGSIPPV